MLSGTPHRLTRVEVLERCYAVHPASAAVPSLSAWLSRSRGQVTRAAAQGDGQLGQLRLGDTSPPPGQRGSMTRLSASHNRVGQRWIDQQVWPAERWRDLWREPDAPAQTGFLPARQFCKAQIVLSDVVLGAVNSRTPRRAIYRTRPLLRLGELTLGEAAEIEWRALTEMQISISGLTENLPYVFDDIHPSLLRLLTGSTPSSSASRVAPARVPVLSTRALWQGQTWSGVRWPSSSWTDTRELIGSSHSTQP